MLALAILLAPAARATAPYARAVPPLSTPWTRSVSSVAPLPQYPRPQLERSQWQSLNGRWQYESGALSAAPPFRRALAQTILVPFPVQSPLSGIARADRSGWYRRLFTITPAWRGRHVMLNFGAVSYSARVYVNHVLAGTHLGDYTAFSLDITPLLRRRGPNQLIVGFSDPVGGAGEPVGKQVPGVPNGIFHTASSGIWQTVWLEPVASEHISDLQLTPDLAHSQLVIDAAATGAGREQVSAEALAGTRVVASATGRPGQPLALPIPHPQLWSPAHPYLYSLRIRLRTGKTTLDTVQSYFGMRSLTLGRVGGVTRLLLNGHFVFESGVLDQGYWPDGLYAAPTDAALRFDIAAAKGLGYNMIREHVKVAPDRWYYWADRLGILVWQDMPNLPIAEHRPPSPAAKAEFRRELTGIVAERRSHPSIVTWVPFNEGWDQFDVGAVTRQVRALDPAALVDSDSGSANCCNAVEVASSDIRDSHAYFGPYAVAPDRRASAIGEYGGVLPFPPPGHIWPGVLESLGSPVLPWSTTIVDPFLRRQYALLSAEMRFGGLSAAVFTELSGYEQELGILTYDRGAYTVPPSLLAGLNHSIIGASTRLPRSGAQHTAIPPGSTGLWRFDEAAGSLAGDASGHGNSLALEAGAGWTPGIEGGALALRRPGAFAIAPRAVIDPTRSFTVSAWLSTRLPRQSGTAVSEPGTAGSAFSLGIATESQGAQSLSGEVGRRRVLAPGFASWWTFAVPASPGCPAIACGVQANLRYSDGRGQPALGSWHQVTGVYDAATQTTSLYVNGVPQDVEHIDAMPRATGPLTIGVGSQNYAPPDAFVGAIDELRTYARALDPGEVWALYTAERPG